MSGVGHDWTFALRHENQGAGAFCLVSVAGEDVVFL